MKPFQNFVYVAGPMGSGEERESNCEKGALIGEKLIHAGIAPFVPHLCQWWTMTHDPPPSYATWILYDLSIIDRCDALYRIAGHSPGADIEEKYAIEKGIPVFYSLEELIAHFKETNNGEKRMERT